MPLIVLFLLWSGAELLLAARLAQLIGVGGVLLWLVAAAALGVFLIRRQGLQTLRELQQASRDGEMPGEALLRGGLVIGAGVLLIIPGLLTDLFALVLLLLRLRRGGLRFAARVARPMMRRGPVTLDGEYAEVPPSRLPKS